MVRKASEKRWLCSWKARREGSVWESVVRYINFELFSTDFFKIQLSSSIKTPRVIQTRAHLSPAKTSGYEKQG